MTITKFYRTNTVIEGKKNHVAEWKKGQMDGFMANNEFAIFAFLFESARIRIALLILHEIMVFIVHTHTRCLLGQETSDNILLSTIRISTLNTSLYMYMYIYIAFFLSFSLVNGLIQCVVLAHSLAQFCFLILFDQVAACCTNVSWDTYYRIFAWTVLKNITKSLWIWNQVRINVCWELWSNRIGILHSDCNGDNSRIDGLRSCSLFRWNSHSYSHRIQIRKRKTHIQTHISAQIVCPLILWNLSTYYINSAKSIGYYFFLFSALQYFLSILKPLE